MEIVAFVYRYIDLEAQEVVYIGKVTKGCDADYNPLRRRHEQHMREEWYTRNADNLVMQFIEVGSHADADILETWLISKYGTGQLVNISKSGWGESRIDMWALTRGRWRTLQKNSEAGYEGAEMLYELMGGDGLPSDYDSPRGLFCSILKDMVREKDKVRRLSQCNEQGDFIRTKAKEPDGVRKKGLCE